MTMTESERAPDVRKRDRVLKAGQLKALLAMEIAGQCPGGFLWSLGTLQRMGLADDLGYITPKGREALRAHRATAPASAERAEVDVRMRILHLSESMRCALIALRGKKIAEDTRVLDYTLQALTDRGLARNHRLTPYGVQVANKLIMQRLEGCDSPSDWAKAFAESVRGADAAPVDPAARSEDLKGRLSELVAEGLTFSQCVEAFGVKRDENPFARAAREQHAEEGQIEIDDITVVSGCDRPDGDYVLAWVWGETESDHSTEEEVA